MRLSSNGVACTNYRFAAFKLNDAPVINLKLYALDYFMKKYQSDKLLGSSACNISLVNISLGMIWGSGKPLK